MAKNKADSAAATAAIITTDEHAGMGGSFVIDPTTGQRKRVEFTEPAPDANAEKQPDKE